jgi:hypothetical protein
MNLTKKHIEYFKKRIFYYQKKFNLQDWEIAIKTKKSDTRFLNAYKDSEWFNNVCTVWLLTDYRLDSQGIYKDLDKTARHEMIHLILDKLAALAYKRSSTEDDIHTELEVVVRKITNLLK